MECSEVAASNIKHGDIFYVLVNKRYYFFQVIHIAENAAKSYGEQYRFGYFIVVLNQTFAELPASVNDVDLTTIFQPKYIWRKTLFYFSLWNKEHCICFKRSLMHYEYKDKYRLVKFGNANVTESFSPVIEHQYSLPASGTENKDGIQISHSPLSIQMVIWALEEEEKGKTKKRNATVPRFFKEWLEYVELEYILKTEKILIQFEVVELQENAQKALKKAVIAINKLDEKFGFISTIEAENIIDQLVEISTKKGLSEQEAALIIEGNREW